jgi:cysteine desulfurase
MKLIYLDHNATTPIDPEIQKKITQFIACEFGNPSSIHEKGRSAKEKIEASREKVANLIDADSSEIVFTSSGTEADNLAIKGVFNFYKNRGNHIITTSIEHPAVLDTCKYLSKLGAHTTTLKVNTDGEINLDDLKNAITPSTILISIMHANNEIGVINNIEKITRIAKDKEILVHTDAVQSVGKIPVSTKSLGVDLLTLSAHKIYGTKGIGALYIRKGLRIDKIIHGGHQERGLRAGTENTIGIMALGSACEIAKRDLPLYETRVRKLRDKLENGILKTIPNVKINGSTINRVPNTTNISFEYIEGEAILLSLDMYGIAASSGSACTSGSLDPSHVLLAIGLSHETAHGSVRFSLGKNNTEEEIDFTLEKLPSIINRLREISPLYKKAYG